MPRLTFCNLCDRSLAEVVNGDDGQSCVEVPLEDKERRLLKGVHVRLWLKKPVTASKSDVLEASGMQVSCRIYSTVRPSSFESIVAF